MGREQTVTFDHALTSTAEPVTVQVEAQWYPRVGPCDDADDYDEVGDITVRLDGADVTRLVSVGDMEAIAQRVTPVARDWERGPVKRRETCRMCGTRPADAAYLGCCSKQCEAARHLRTAGGAL